MGEIRSRLTRRRLSTASSEHVTDKAVVAHGPGLPPDVWVEMKKVSWPGRSEVVGTTVVVIVACFLFGFYLFVVDSGLSWLIDKIFRAAGVIA